MSDRSITFLASLPPFQSAIKTGRDGVRIQLDIPESEKMNAAPVQLLFDRLLRITIEAVPDTVNGANAETSCE